MYLDRQNVQCDVNQGEVMTEVAYNGNGCANGGDKTFWSPSPPLFSFPLKRVRDRGGLEIQRLPCAPLPDLFLSPNPS